MILCGCDVGDGAVKLVVMEEGEKILFTHAERIRRRNPVDVVRACFDRAGGEGLPESAFAYLAATGEGEAVPGASGIFYGMTCHARGARFLFPETATVLDMGALHMRAMRLDEKGKVVSQKMTSQCASGTGRFMENIARHLGLGLEELPELSSRSTWPRPLSTVCAVLAETDIINLVSKGAPLPDIVGGIYDSIARRAAGLLCAVAPRSPLILTGGLAGDAALLRALDGQLRAEGLHLEIRSHEMSVYAGAIGAALWGGTRLRRRKK